MKETLESENEIKIKKNNAKNDGVNKRTINLEEL